ncbi:MAG: YfiR family protein [Porticoccaceae bacterium]
MATWPAIAPPRPALAALLAALLALFTSLAAAENPLEAKVKAAYLFNLTKFVDWPDLPADALHICVIGSDAIGGLLGELRDRRVKDRPLRIDRNGGVVPGNCQVLFISRSEDGWRDILQGLSGSTVLTVSDRDSFASNGGMVGFYTESGKVKLEINPQAARDANLHISSKLLELARSVP